VSEENTRDMAQRYDTKPTVETVLERISALGTEMREGLARIETRLDDFDVRLDRMESDVSKTRSEMLALRADFKEFRAHFREPV